MVRRNVTSSIRKGFKYQDLWALRLCAEWLMNPGAYIKLELETAPEGVGSKSFHLEDIVVTNLNNTYSLFQIKHTQKPLSNKWTWKKFLSKGLSLKSKKRSLFQKWFDSYSNSSISKNISQASLMTNGVPDSDLKMYLDFETGRIDIDQIEIHQPKLYSSLLVQAGNNSEKLKLFFRNFCFFFGRKDIDQLNQVIENIFYKELKATESGLNKLRIRITEECEKEHPEQLTFQIIKTVCEFDNPRPLNEEFIIPEDFELFDRNFHKEMILDLKSITGGVKIIYGNPGSGKSTYLSKLYRDLKKRKITVFKHHYFISADDPNYKERLQSKRVVEAIKAELKQNFDELGDLAKQNSAQIQLREFLKKLGETYKSKNEPFVLIVDGLDHAIRHSSKEELLKFLEELSYPVSNFWLILGTQESALPLLPKSIKDRCPEHTIKQIIGLSKNSVSKIVRRNIIGLNFGDNFEQINDLVAGLFSLTKGNPLHLHYTLFQLRSKFKNSLVTNYSLNYLKPYDQSIEQYYLNLWSGLSPTAKTFCLVICSVNFFFKKQYFFDLAGDLTKAPTDVSNGFDDVVHLLSIKSEKITIYHESFKIFVLGQQEYVEQKSAIKKKIRSWLKVSNYQDLKWAELKKIEFELGNPKPILAIDLNWIIDSLISPRNEDQILSQLNLAAKAAALGKDFSALARITLQRLYFENNAKYSEDTYDELWIECFDQLKTDVDEYNLEDLSSEQLLSVVTKFKRIGKVNEVCRAAFEIIRERCSSISIGDKNSIGGTSRPDIVEHLIRVYSLDNGHKPEYVHKIVTRILRQQNWSEEFIGIYVSSLLESDQYSKIDLLLKLPWSTKERNQILDLCAEHDFLFSEKRFLEIIKSHSKKNPSIYCLFYLAMNKQSLPSFPGLPPYLKFPRTVQEYIPDHQEGDSSLFFDSFLLGFIYQAVGKSELILEWVEKSEKRWPVEIASVLFTEAVQFSKCYSQSKKIKFQSLIEALEQIQPLNFPEDRDLIGMQRSLSIAIKKIFKLVYVLNKSIKPDFMFSKDDVDGLKRGSYFNINNFFEGVCSISRPCLNASAADCFAPSKPYKDLLSYQSLSERARNYLKLSKIMKNHGRDKEALVYLRLAARNFMGHGYHKDTIGFDILRCISHCYKFESGKVENWIAKTLPIIENYSDFTDGDETNHLPNELANVLQEINPILLYKFYAHVANEEDLYLAERIFPKVLRTFSFKHDFEKAVAESAIDKESFEVLEEISQTNKDAKTVFDAIRVYFGNIKHPEDRDSGSSSVSPPVVVDYSTIEPKDLKEGLARIDGWEKSRIFSPWYAYWRKKGVDKKEIYDALVGALDDSEDDRFNGSLYDLLYPLAYEYDAELSFEYLCMAQIYSHGWNFFWEIKENTIARWAFLKRHFPGRHFDFFVKTTLSHDMWREREQGYSFPIPSGVEFLIFFGENEIAEKVTDEIVNFCSTLTADMRFEGSKWFNSKSYDLLDLLLQRLLWPSPLVRERVANAIHKLLLNPATSKQVLKRLMGWMETQPLISVKTLALLPIVKTMEENPSIISKQDLRGLKKYHPSMSAIFNLLLKQLGQTKKTVSKKILHNYFPPSSYQINKTFLKTIKSYLPPDYYDRAERISNKIKIDFVKSWSFMAEKLMRRFYPKVTNEDVLYFMGRKDDPFLAGMSSKKSEIYRSAYLMALHVFRSANLIDGFMYYENSFAAMPIDFSYWKINPSRAPDWWPVIETTPSQSATIVNISYEKNVEKVIAADDGYKVIGLSGPMKPTEGWASTINNSLILEAFFYEITGPNIPTAEEVGREMVYSSYVKLDWTRTDSPFHFLKSYDHYFFVAGQMAIKDLIVYPIVALNHKTISSVWQWFRLMPTPEFIPVPQIADGLKIEVESNRYTFKDMNEKNVFISEDWTEGVTERQITDLQIPHGSSLKVEKNHLEALLAQHNLRLGYLYKFSHFEKKDRYSDAKQVSDYHLVGVNNIIL